MKLFNKRLNLSSDDVLACEDYAQLKWWYSEVEMDTLSMETQLMERYSPNMEKAMILQKKLSKLIQLRLAQVGKPKQFEWYIVQVCKELLSDRWDEVVQKAMDKKNLEDI